jgi:hypothetical protein
MMLTILNPALTLIIYALQAEIRGAKSIDVEVAFTSFAIIGLVTRYVNFRLESVVDSGTKLSGSNESS